MTFIAIPYVNTLVLFCFCSTDIQKLVENKKNCNDSFWQDAKSVSIFPTKVEKFSFFIRQKEKKVSLISKEYKKGFNFFIKMWKVFKFFQNFVKIFHFFPTKAKSISFFFLQNGKRCFNFFDKLRKVFHFFQQKAKSVYFFPTNAKSVSLSSTKCKTFLSFLIKCNEQSGIFYLGTSFLLFFALLSMQKKIKVLNMCASSEW